MKWLVFFLWLGLLLPTAIYDLWKFQFSDFNFRIGYFGIIFLVLVYLWDPGRRKTLGTYFGHGQNILFLIMGAFGLISALLSAKPEISLLFWIWTLGTLLFLPLVLRSLLKILEKPIVLSVYLFLLMNLLVIFWDFMVLNSGHPSLSLGRFIVKYVSGDVFHRLYAWNYEPSYFAGFALMAALSLRAWGMVRAEKNENAWILGLYFLTFPGVFLTTARTGISGIAVLILVELVFLLIFVVGKIKRRRDSSEQVPRGLNIFNARAMIVFSTLFLIVLASIIWVGVTKKEVYRDTFKHLGLKNPKRDGAFLLRFSDVKDGYSVFLKSPWVGSGPGLAKHSLFQKQPERAGKFGPIGNSVYLELLSEWGAVGFIFFLTAIIAMFLRAPVGIKVRVWALLSVLYFSLGTIPRLDLWLYLALIWGVTQLTPKNEMLIEGSVRE